MRFTGGCGGWTGGQTDRQLCDQLAGKKAVSLFTDKNRQEPTRAVKSRQEAFLGIFQLKYYLLDPIHALFI